MAIPPQGRKLLRTRSPVELGLVLRASLPPTVREPLPPGTGLPLTSLGHRVLRLVLRILRELRSRWTPAQLELVQRITGVPQRGMMVSRCGGILQVQSRCHLLPQLRHLTGANKAGTVRPSPVERQAMSKQIWCRWLPWQRTQQAERGYSPLSARARHSHPYSLVPRTVALDSLQSEPQNFYQSSTQCQLMMEIRSCPLFPYPWWQVVMIHPARRCTLLAWMYSMNLQTWQHRWDTTACSNKLRMIIGSNHHTRCNWTSTCGFPDLSLCGSCRCCTWPAGLGCCHHSFGHVENDEYHATATAAYGFFRLWIWTT